MGPTPAPFDGASLSRIFSDTISSNETVLTL
jgi:hypothetical protein